MVRSLALASSLLFVALTAVGCGPPWTVLQAQAPNPLVGKTRFAVHPVDMTRFTVGGKEEPDYLSDKDEETRRDWHSDKQGLAEEYTQKLIERANELGLSVVPATGPDSAPYFIRPRVDYIEPGFYVGVAAGSSQVRMTVLVTTPDGGVVDEVMMEHSTGGSMTNPSVGGRLRDDGEALGETTADYLLTRVAPE